MSIGTATSETKRWRGLRIVVKPGSGSLNRNWKKRFADLLAYDFFPDIDKLLIDWIRRPLGILALAIVFSGLCGLVIHSHGFVLMGALILIVLIGLLWPWFSILGLKPTLQFVASRATEGDTVPVRMQVKNRMPWCAWGLGVQVTETSSQADAGLSHACGWKTTEATWNFIPRHRGEYPSGQPHLFCGFPFGLCKARREMIVKQPLLVWPRTFHVGAIPEVSGSEFHEGQVFRNKPGTAGDILGVRPFREGDSLRRIHWPQTARHGKLIVCERQTPGLPSIQIILDTHSEGHSGAGTDSSREWAIRIAASLAAGWLEQGAQIETVIQGKALAMAGGMGQKRKVLDALARIAATGDLTLTDLLQLPVCRKPQSSITVLITTDTALQTPAVDHARLRGMLVIALRTEGFIDSDETSMPFASTGQLPIQPWIEVTNPEELPTLFRKTWKGAAHAG